MLLHYHIIFIFIVRSSDVQVQPFSCRADVVSKRCHAGAIASRPSMLMYVNIYMPSI